jgi:hypothetical protein
MRRRNALSRHPGGGDRRECQQGRKCARGERVHEEAERPDGNSHRHRLHDRSGEHPPAQGCIVEREAECAEGCVEGAQRLVDLRGGKIARRLPTTGKIANKGKVGNLATFPKEEELQNLE